MQIEIDKKILKKCELFADKRMEGSSSLYKYRGANKLDKIREDIIIGTLAEWGAHQYLKAKGIDVNKPDMKIYEKRRKSFSADLLNDDLRFHVKSQSLLSSERYGMSWLFQKSDKILKAPEADEHFIFTQVDNNVVSIKAIVLVKDIVENNLVGVPKIPWYANTKHALYLDDILESDIDLWRF